MYINLLNSCFAAILLEGAALLEVVHCFWSKDELEHHSKAAFFWGHELEAV